MVMGDQGALCGLPWPVCPVDLGQRLSSRAGTAWCPSCGRRWPLDAVEPTIQNGGGKLLRRLVDGKLGSVQHAPQVGLEAFVVVGQELVGDAKQPGEGFALLVVAARCWRSSGLMNWSTTSRATMTGVACTHRASCGSLAR